METKKRRDGIWSPIFDKTHNAKLERDIVEVLKEVPIFEELTQREIQNIARIAYPRNYNEGEVVIHEGEAAAGMYIIMDGEAEVTKKSKDGIIIQLATF